MIKFASKRVDVSPKRTDYQQTERYVLPVLTLWADGKKYKKVGFTFGWWKWTVHFFFSIF
jgi:hypothetical protein